MSAPTRVLGAVTLLLALVACATDDPVPATSQPAATNRPRTPLDDDWLVYETDGGRVAYVRPDGNDTRFPDIDASPPPSPQDNPDWSPDGTRVTFVAGDGLWIMDAEGNDAHLLVTVGAGESLDDPTWSPDGKRIAYSRNTDTGEHVSSVLDAVDLTTGATSTLTGPWPSAVVAGAAWSPDGTRVAFERVHVRASDVDAAPVGVDLMILDLAAGTTRSVLDARRFPETAAWSPDGSWIAIGYRPRRGEPRPDLHLVRPDGTGLFRLTHLTDRGGFATHPSFLRDGSAVVISAATGANSPAQLMLAGLTGTPPTPVGSSPVVGSHPKVRPLPGD